MLPKFSVKKPYTVFVAVILIIVLGVVSFTGMTTDLFPSMELPYVIVITTYPGASPEKVEQAVTRPMEAVLGTASGLENISSVSSENSSMIILEYVQDTNMDSAMIDLSGKIDIVSAQFADGVGQPLLLKISPDMIPIVVASVDREGMNIDELSGFTADTVIPAFERLDGVASVSTGGLVEKQLEITLDEDRLDEVSAQVRAEIEKKLDETRAELEEAQAELMSGRATLEEESTDQKAQLSQASAQLGNAIANLNALLSEEALLNAQKAAFEQEKAGLLQLAELNTVFEQLFPLGVSGLTPEMYASTMQQAAGLLPKEMASLSQMEMTALFEQAKAAPARIAAIDVELQNVNIRQMTMAAMKPQLEGSLRTSEAAYEQLEAGKITMAVELSKAQVQLENGETELEKGLSEFDKAREEALKGADLSQILTQDLIGKLIAAQNFSMPAGYLLEGQDQHLVKVGDAFSSSGEIADMVIFSIEPVGDIRLSDIADIEMADNSSEIYSKVNGNPGVILMFQKVSTASTAEVADTINEAIGALQETYDGLHIRPLMDQGDYIHMITGSVIENLLIGGALAILILLVFLRDVKPTLIIAFSIPISLMAAVALMYFSNVTLNVISLSGLALGVGMLVDNSIVVIENIYRLRHEGYTAVKDAVEGAKEVSGAIASSTLTTICVFLPIVFTQGLSRQLFTDMGLTIAYSLLASLFVALTLVPAMGATLLRKTSEKKHKWFDAIVGLYEKLLRGALRKKAVVLTAAVLLLALSIFGVTIMGTAFMPEIDSPQMSAALEMPEGSSREDTYAINDEVMRRILEIEAVETVGAMTGQQSGIMSMFGGSGGGTSFYILLKDQRTQTNKDVERLIYEKTAGLDATITVSASNMDLSVLDGSGIEVDIKGQELDTLSGIANDIAALLRDTEGTKDVKTGLEDSGRETRITVDKDKAMREGLTVAQVFSEISASLQTQSQAAVLTEGSESYPVMLVKGGQDGLTRETIADYTFTVTQKDGTEKQIALGDIAAVLEADSMTSINRENQSRYLTVSAEIADGYNIGLVSRDFESRLDGYEVPAGYDVRITGENEMIQDSMSDLILMIMLAIVFIYLIMVAQFQNLLSPFIVLFTLPLAFTGGLLLLWVSGMVLSVVAVLGFLVLAGVVVNNGIVFVSYVEQLRESGMDKTEALVQAGITRIRPIVMTALTTILAMVTLALGLGNGAEMMQPMAVVTIGGLTYATLLTLFVVPVLYGAFHRKTARRIETEEA